MLILAAVSRDDTEKDIEFMAAKVLKTKLWDDESTDPVGRWKHNVKEIDGEVLCGMTVIKRSYTSCSRLPVSQFTLLATTKKGNKPDFHQSASGEKARTLYDYFYKQVQTLHGEDKVKNGQFAAMMDVALVNDGPVSLNVQRQSGPSCD